MKLALVVVISLFSLLSCSLNFNKDSPEIEEVDDMISSVKVEAVDYIVSNNIYSFSVTLKSPDLGCDQYADWWEIIDAEGKLLFRRVLSHSHVQEQPFARSGGSLTLSDTATLTLRGHMSNIGYGKEAMRGSIKDGFKSLELKEDYAIDLESESPQPPKCAF